MMTCANGMRVKPTSTNQIFCRLENKFSSLLNKKKLTIDMNKDEVSNCICTLEQDTHYHASNSGI